MLLLKLALRNVLRQQRRSALTCLTIAGGYVLCALSFSLVDGSYSNVIEIFTEDETGHIQIHSGNYLDKPKVHLTIDDPETVEATLSSAAIVSSFAPRIYTPALAYADDEHSPAQVIGVDPAAEARTSRLRQKITAGEWLDTMTNNDGLAGALIGASIAASLEIGIGDEIVLISQGADGSIANDLYRVVGIVGDRRSPERGNVYLPLPAAQTFLTLQGRVHEYAVILDDIDASRETARRLAERLPDLTVSPWQVARATFYNSMQADKKGNTFTLSIILFIVFIGVLNTVLMSVLERTREFGVLKAIGSRPSLIASLIVLETSILSAASLVVGIIVALPVMIWFTVVGIEMPEPIDMGGVQFSAITGGLSLAIMIKPVFIIFGYAIAVSLVPGIHAARVTPIEAMRTF